MKAENHRDAELILAGWVAKCSQSSLFSSNERLKVVVLGSGTWVLQFAPKASLQSIEAKATCTLSLSHALLLKLESGELNPQVEYLRGEIKSDGDRNLLLKVISQVIT